MLPTSAMPSLSTGWTSNAVDESAPKRLEVVAGVLARADGAVLLAQRPAGKHLAGLWEFPGGKHEPGEADEAALRRELAEELGIELGSCQPLISVPFDYPDLHLRLVVLRALHWQGEPQGREGQALCWRQPADIDPASMPAADVPVLAALRLPGRYLITPPAADPDQLPAMFDAAIAGGARLLQLRLPGVARDKLGGLLHQLAPRCRKVDASLLINGDIALAREHGVGVHLRAEQLAELGERPLPQGQWVAASCHDAVELQAAARIGVDFASLSPLAATASHPKANPLGWARFAELIRNAALPVYALGGVGPVDLDRARAAGGQGVAGIRAFW